MVPCGEGKDSALACQSGLIDVNLIADLPDSAVSQHKRPDGSLAHLYHVFLDSTLS